MILVAPRWRPIHSSSNLLFKRSVHTRLGCHTRSGYLFMFPSSSMCVCVWVSASWNVWACTCFIGMPAETWAQRWWRWAASWWWKPPPSVSLEEGCSAARCWTFPSSAGSNALSRCREPWVLQPPLFPPSQHRHPSPVAFLLALSVHTALCRRVLQPRRPCCSLQLHSSFFAGQ